MFFFSSRRRHTRCALVTVFQTCALPSYVLRLVEAFPSVEDLAAADEDQVMRLWQGLGYYSRARNMHATARYVRQEWGTIFPSAYSVLIGLKGIGAYTAAAVASFAGNEARAVVDGKDRKSTRLNSSN